MKDFEIIASYDGSMTAGGPVITHLGFKVFKDQVKAWMPYMGMFEMCSLCVCTSVDIAPINKYRDYY